MKKLLIDEEFNMYFIDNHEIIVYYDEREVN